MGRALAGEFDFLGDLSGGHIVAIFDQGIMFFLQSHDVHIAERLELLDHLEIDLGLFLKVFLQVFLRIAEACQMGIDHIGNAAFVLFAFIDKSCEVLFNDILHIAAWNVADRALEGAFEILHIAFEGIAVCGDGGVAFFSHAILGVI